jgi:hypothetical protein
VQSEVRAGLRGPARVATPVLGPILRRELAKRPDQIMRAFAQEPRPVAGEA